MIKIMFVCDWCEQEHCVPLINVPFFGRTVKPVRSWSNKQGQYCTYDCQKAQELAQKIAKIKVFRERRDFLKSVKGKPSGELRVIQSDMEQRL